MKNKPKMLTVISYFNKFKPKKSRYKRSSQKVNIIVIKDPNHIDGGTIFKPTEGINYLKDIK